MGYFFTQFRTDKIDAAVFIMMMLSYLVGKIK